MFEFFYYLIAMVASYFISQALATQPAPPDAATFDDFDFPQADEGTPQAVAFGDVWSKSWMVLAVGNMRTWPIGADSGGK